MTPPLRKMVLRSRTRTPPAHAARPRDPRMAPGGHGYRHPSPARQRRSICERTSGQRSMSTAASASLWEDPTRPAFPEPLPPSGHVDTLVVGGGLTGLVTALLLARAGVEVAVLEARRIGSGTTGSSTAKVSLVQGTKLSRIRSRHPLRVARAYAEANREGQAWLREFCDDHDVPYATRPAGTYAATASELSVVHDEYDALQAVGLPVRWSDSL